jgi:hypothetical protein
MEEGSKKSPLHPPRRRDRGQRKVHLGVRMTSDMSLGAIIAHREEDSAKKLQALRRFLCNKDIPLSIKLRVYNCFFAGGDVWCRIVGRY